MHQPQTATIPVTRPNFADEPEAAEPAESALARFAQATGDVFLLSSRCGRDFVSVEMHAGPDGRERALSRAEHPEFEDCPKPDFISAIVLHPGGTWERVELFERDPIICELDTAALGNPSRQFDYRAVRDGYEPGCPMGSGATKEAAVADLLQQEGER